jgi:hypothetical protein
MLDPFALSALRLGVWKKVGFFCFSFLLLGNGVLLSIIT